MNKIEPGRFPAGTGARTRHTHHRVLHFKDGASWLAYNDRFGSGDAGIYGAITTMINERARDLAILDVLGPKPEVMARVIHDVMDQAKAQRAVDEAPTKTAAGRAADVAKAPLAWGEGPDAFWRTWQTQNGTLTTPHSQAWRDLNAGIRGWLVAKQLGRVLLTSINDLYTFSRAATWNGLPAARAIAAAMKNMLPGNAEHRAWATGLGIQAYTARNALARRFADTELTGGTWGEAFADFTIRAQGHAAWTHSLASQAQLAMRQMLGGMTDLEIHALPDPVQAMFQRYGIEAKHWDMVRAGNHVEMDGAHFLDPTAILRDRGQSPERLDAASRIWDAMEQEGQFFVVQPDSRVRAMMGLGTQAGTFAGEGVRAMAMYKSFSVAILMTHVARDLSEAGRIGQGLGRSAPLIGAMAMQRVATFLIGMTVFGAMAIQMKQIATGKDPLDMTTGDFWKRSFLQGGGLGIMGDFLASTMSRSHNTLIPTLAGPVAGLAEDVVKLAWSPYRQWVEGDDIDTTSDAVRFLIEAIPASNIWYAGQTVDRIVGDTLMRLVDPDYDASFRRMERRARKLYGQEHYWPPGQMAPERMPNLGAAWGEG